MVTKEEVRLRQQYLFDIHCKHQTWFDKRGNPLGAIMWPLYWTNPEAEFHYKALENILGTISGGQVYEKPKPFYVGNPKR